MPRFRFAPFLLALGALVNAAQAPAATTPATAKPAVVRNLLSNPGFEETRAGHAWMPTDWDTTVSGMPTVFFGRDTMLAHGRGYAVSVVNVSTLVPMNHGWIRSLLVPSTWWGKDVVFSVWTRSNGVTGRAFVRATVYRDTINKMAKLWKVSRTTAADRLSLRGMNDPVMELGWNVRYFSDEETDWVRREVRVPVAPSTNFLLLSLGLAGNGQVLFDDASLTIEAHRPDPALPLHTNLIADASFEGSGDDWEYSAPPYEGFRVERDTTEGHTGRSSLRCLGGVGGPVKVHSGACQTFMNRTLVGKRLRLSAWIKTDSLATDASVMLYFKTVRGTEHPVPDEIITGTHPWKQTSIEADVPLDTYEVWAWVLYAAPATGRIWWDDVRLEVLGPASTSVAGRRKTRP
jgi:hypothetical protein